MQELISVKNLSFKYFGPNVVEGVSFSVNKGDYIGIIGPNGSGKTTLLKLILGLLKPYEGSISILGTDISNFKNWGGIGYLPQNIKFINPYFPATVREIITTGLLSKKKFPKKLDAKDFKQVKHAAEISGVHNIIDKTINELSGGQQQRVLLARALVNNPDIIFLDEPSSALDHESREKFFGLIKNLNSEKKLTIMLVTHDMTEIGKYVSKLLFIDRKLIFFGDTQQFCHSNIIEGYFGAFTQHLICHRHDRDINKLWK